MPLDPKRLARDARQVQSTRPDSLVGRETTGVTRAVRAALPAIRKLRAAQVTWAAIAEAMSRQGIRQRSGEPLTASRLTSIVSQVEQQERRKVERNAGRQARGDLAEARQPSRPTTSERPASRVEAGKTAPSTAVGQSEEALRRQGLAELNKLLKG